MFVWWCDAWKYTLSHIMFLWWFEYQLPLCNRVATNVRFSTRILAQWTNTKLFGNTLICAKMLEFDYILPLTWPLNMYKIIFITDLTWQNSSSYRNIFLVTKPILIVSTCNVVNLLVNEYPNGKLSIWIKSWQEYRMFVVALSLLLRKSYVLCFCKFAFEKQEALVNHQRES